MIPALRSLGWAGYLPGFGLRGFFDGILLHQILQWHHLLPLVMRAPFQDLRIQILADGLFHLLMYVIGFGAWHILDRVLSHWLFGIHRVRLDSDKVLFWDLLWFVVFGVAFAVLGWWLRRRGGAAAPPPASIR